MAPISKTQFTLTFDFAASGKLIEKAEDKIECVQEGGKPQRHISYRIFITVV